MRRALAIDEASFGPNVAHLSPARYAHINPYGKYRFNVAGGALSAAVDDCSDSLL
jgi:hypothetical protein